MPYKNKNKQRKAVREASRKHRAKKKQELVNFEAEFRRRNAALARDLARKFPGLFPSQKKRRRKK